ncbi:MAG: hypothetical protein KIT27_00250 [Legionellales bacterium]|nr:hypothetical protein [Legionellales bacterium]
MPTKIKINLYDGDIERPIHGAMHVARVQTWVVVLNEKFKEIFPTYHQTIFKYLSATLHLTEPEIITLTRYAALLHDSARKHEASDLWDKDSANNAYEFFIKKGLSTKVADLFSQAIALKNHPKEFAKYLKSKNYRDEEVTNLQYIQKLIYLADCFDIMRCVSQFRLNQALKVISDIAEYEQEQHVQTILELAENIYNIIQQQYDMLWPCRIILTTGAKPKRQ